MEVGNVPNIGPQKADDLRETQKVRKDAANVYAKADAGGNDTVAVSAKAKLLLGLREKYDQLPDQTEKLQDLKEKVQAGTHDMSAEEIVTSILKGTLFNVI